MQHEAPAAGGQTLLLKAADNQEGGCKQEGYTGRPARQQGWGREPGTADGAPRYCSLVGWLPSMGTLAKLMGKDTLQLKTRPRNT